MKNWIHKNPKLATVIGLAVIAFSIFAYMHFTYPETW